MIQFYLQLIEAETDQEKFEKLYYKYRRLMRKIAYDLLQDTHRSEDAVHDAFLRIIKNFHKIGEIDCPETKAFVVIIVRNVALNSIKKDNQSEKMFYYNQSVVTETMNLSLDNEAESFAEIEINGHRGYSVDEPEYSAITWSDGVSLYTISGNISLQELIPIAESIE